MPHLAADPVVATVITSYSIHYTKLYDALGPEAASAATLIGHLNLTHPNRIQVAGADEAAALERLAGPLFEAEPAAVILADGVPASSVV